MKTSALLRLATLYLWDGESQIGDRHSYICHALFEAANAAVLYQNKSREEVEAAHRRATRHINICITPYATLSRWVYRSVPGSSQSLHTFANEHLYLHHFRAMQMQSYRLRWLKHLIKHFEAQGD